MNVGDLVKRSSIWGEWVKHNSWMLEEEEAEIGMIVDIKTYSSGRQDIIVHWPFSGVSWEERENLEEIE
jgi:hypothetical protein